MKKIMAICIIAAATFYTPACKDNTSRADEKNVISAEEVPTAVKSAFTAKYPNALEVIWENAHEKDVATFKVKFKLNDEYMKAEFKEDGYLVKESEDN